MSFEELRSEVHETYMENYVAGFKNNNVTLIDKMVKYPIAYIKNGTVTMCDSYPIDPKSLKEEKGWDHSVEWKFEVTAVNDSEAHGLPPIKWTRPIS